MVLMVLGCCWIFWVPRLLMKPHVWWVILSVVQDQVDLTLPAVQSLYSNCFEVKVGMS